MTATKKHAQSRPDLSEWLVHLTRGAEPGVNGTGKQQKEALYSILSERALRPSVSNDRSAVYCPVGGACFFDVPPPWKVLVNTNTAQRLGFGVIVCRGEIWRAGGRPVIYTDCPSSQKWPEDERYRLVATNLDRQPYALDWTHEREWRVRGGLSLDGLGSWWPCVPWDGEVLELLRTFDHISEVYSMQSERVIRADLAEESPRVEQCVTDDEWTETILEPLPADHARKMRFGR